MFRHQSLSATFYNDKWTRWIIQTSRSMDDLSDLIKKTGIDSVDEDHDVMIQAVLKFNDLLDHIDAEGLSMGIIEELQKLLKDFHCHAEQHFLQEERIIAKYEIDGLAQHKAQHQLFLKHLKQYSHSILSGKFQILHGLKLFILEWWIDHINNMDFKTFCSGNWSTTILKEARVWEDVCELIRKMRVEVIDKGHKKLTKYILEICRLVEQQNAGQIAETDPLFEKTLQKMRDFAEQHFIREEQIIAKYKLKNLEDQQYNHQFLLACFDAYIEDLQEKRLVLDESFKSTLLELWISHINDVDYQTFCTDNWIEHIVAQAKEWEDLSELICHVGVEIVDQQHQQITEYLLEMNEFIDYYQKYKTQDSEILQKLGELFQRLYYSVVVHFQREEKIMQENDVSRFYEHQQQHQLFLELLLQYREELISEKIVPTQKLKSSLLNEWISHINGIDQGTVFSHQK